MKSIKQLSFIGLAIMLVISSCTMEKRVYTSGYHIEWNKSKHNTDKRELVNKDSRKPTVEQSENETNRVDNSLVQTVTDNNITASVDNLPELFTANNFLSKEKIYFLKKSEVKSIATSEDCDIIILKNGQEIKAKVLEIGSAEIKHKEYANLNGPTFSKNKSEVFMIKYTNGTSTVISEDVKTNSVRVNVNNNSSAKTSSKSRIVAILLWFFLGILGIHRFYLGYFGMGILYLLTGGLCGIGWLIDGILFLTGGLKPKDGDYVD